MRNFTKAVCSMLLLLLPHVAIAKQHTLTASDGITYVIASDGQHQTSTKLLLPNTSHRIGERCQMVPGESFFKRKKQCAWESIVWANEKGEIMELPPGMAETIEIHWRRVITVLAITAMGIAFLLLYFTKSQKVVRFLVLGAAICSAVMASTLFEEWIKGGESVSMVLSAIVAYFLAMAVRDEKNKCRKALSITYIMLMAIFLLN